jgi:homoserine kinase
VASAALAVAAAAAAGAGDDAFGFGVRTDGHPENAAAAAFGGLVAATTVGGSPVWRHLALDPALVFVAVVPSRELLTGHARSVLSPTVSRDDAVFNLGRSALLIAGLADRRQLIPEAGDDRMHQDERASLFPESAPILAGLRRAGALTSFWSGAGPTLMAVCERGASAAVAEAARGLLDRHRVAGRVQVVEADRQGITLSG